MAYCNKELAVPCLEDGSSIPRTHSEKSRLNHQKSSPDLTHALCIYTPTQDKCFFLKKKAVTHFLQHNVVNLKSSYQYIKKKNCQTDMTVHVMSIISAFQRLRQEDKSQPELHRVPSQPQIQTQLITLMNYLKQTTRKLPRSKGRSL